MSTEATNANQSTASDCPHPVRQMDERGEPYCPVCGAILAPGDV